MLFALSASRLGGYVKSDAAENGLHRTIHAWACEFSDNLDRFRNLAQRSGFRVPAVEAIRPKGFDLFGLYANLFLRRTEIPA